MNEFIHNGNDSISEIEYPGNFAWEKPGIGKNIFTLFLIGLVFNIALLSLENVRLKLKKVYSIMYKYWTHLRKNPGIITYIINYTTK